MQTNECVHVCHSHATNVQNGFGQLFLPQPQTCKLKMLAAKILFYNQKYNYSKCFK